RTYQSGCTGYQNLHIHPLSLNKLIVRLTVHPDSGITPTVWPPENGSSTIEDPLFFCICPKMSDPLAQIVTLLQPTAPFSKRGSAAGRWRVHRTEVGNPFYCAILEGMCRLEADGHDEIVLQEGDFVLIPTAHNFTMSSLLPASDEHIISTPLILPNGEHRLGDPEEAPDTRLLVGYCVFRSP